MKRIILTIIGLVASVATFAQNARFATQGVIEYEKKVNMYGLMKDYIKKHPTDSWMPRMFEEYQKNQPQFKVLKSTLTFGKEQTLYKPVEATASPGPWEDFAAAVQPNTIYTDLTNPAAGNSSTQKKVYEETYLVKDSVRRINWKITDEIRNIAGYDCRRANALIMDSIYVVAFYTDEIPVSGGPESFTGLPGMILGVALPYEHTTWFATAVTDQPVTDDKLKAPVKGKPVSHTQLITVLKSALKDWGEYAQDALKAFLL